jgi:hypothetical protein
MSTERAALETSSADVLENISRPKSIGESNAACHFNATAVRWFGQEGDGVTITQ